MIVGAGAQIITPSSPRCPSSPEPGPPTPVGSFNVTELGDKADKVGKDNNFRGLAVYNNVDLLHQGSGGNGVNTVYFVDTSGSRQRQPAACPTGVRRAEPGGAAADHAASPSTPRTCRRNGVDALQHVRAERLPDRPRQDRNRRVRVPVRCLVRQRHTLYVADEGSGDNAYSTASNSYTAAAASTTAGLQKWVLNTTTHTWSLAYTLQAGLDLGVPYTVKGYPTGNNAATGLPWSPATDGLRNLTGRVNHDGTVSIWAITSTVSGGGDQGADPNKLVMITDKLAATTLPANESFSTVRTAESAKCSAAFRSRRARALAPARRSLRCSATSESVRRSIEEHDPEKCVAVFRRDHAELIKTGASGGFVRRALSTSPRVNCAGRFFMGLSCGPHRGLGVARDQLRGGA